MLAIKEIVSLVIAVPHSGLIRIIRSYPVGLIDNRVPGHIDYLLYRHKLLVGLGIVWILSQTTVYSPCYRKPI